MAAIKLTTPNQGANMTLPDAIIGAAIILGCSYGIGNLYKLSSFEGLPIRINTVTGTVSFCGQGVCQAFKEK
jgi:hypothetical protein